MLENMGHIVWTVEAVDETAGDHRFDAQVLYHPLGEPSRDEDRAKLMDRLNTFGRMQYEGRYFGHAVPFSGQLPNVPLSLVVVPHTGCPPVKVSFTAFNADGAPRASGYSYGPRSLIVHTAIGTGFSSLLESAPLPRPTDE
jgi:hypothetical protein